MRGAGGPPPPGHVPLVGELGAQNRPGRAARRNRGEQAAPKGFQERQDPAGPGPGLWLRCWLRCHSAPAPFVRGVGALLQRRLLQGGRSRPPSAAGTWLGVNV